MRQQIASADQPDRPGHAPVRRHAESDGRSPRSPGWKATSITMQDIFVFDRTGLRRDGKVCGRFRATGIRPRCTERLLSFGVQLPVDMFEHVTLVA